MPCGTEDCVLPFAGYPQSITAIVLNISGINFALEVVLSLAIGSTADYGTWRPWVTILFTVAAWATGFGWLAVDLAAQWPPAVALYILGTVATDLSLLYYSAAMPGLARDQPHVQASEAEVRAGQKSPEEHLQLDMLERNRVGDYALMWNSFPCVVWLGIAAGILAALQAAGGDEGVDSNTRALSIIIVYFTGILVVGTVPWFFEEQRRLGQKLPPGTNYLTVGVMNCKCLPRTPKAYTSPITDITFSLVWYAMKEVRKLKQVFIYLIAYLILGDALTTTSTVIGTLTNSVVEFDATLTNYLNMTVYAAQGIGIGVLWLVQRRFNLTTKTVLLVNVLFIVGLCIWGFIGIWAAHAGFKTRGEVWAYQVYYGLFVCQFFQLPLTFISDLVPRPKIFLFWSLFSISGTASAFVGPFVTSAIIDRSGGNTNMAFAFLLPFTVLGVGVLWLVDPAKAVFEAREYLEDEARALQASIRNEGFKCQNKGI